MSPEQNFRFRFLSSQEPRFMSNNELRELSKLISMRKEEREKRG